MEMPTQARTIQSFLGPALLPNGAREGDDFVIDVFQGRKNALKLNRTRYLFKFEKQYLADFQKAHFALPGFGDLKGEFQLELASFSLREHNSNSRYIFRSLSGTPFKLNGMYAFEAFIERGDIVDLGYNRLLFLKNEEKKERELPLSPAVMKSTLPILLEGETGTGKTTLAKKIHEESGRAGAFVHVNLSAFSSSLVESELFGHVRGAFTGAINAKKGAILEAHRGTLFLDEIDSLSIELQTKLLLFLDNYEFRAVGAEHSQKVSVRLIFASGSELQKKVMEGKMRKDFYYRLRAGNSLRLASLREKKEEIRSFCLGFEKEEGVVISEDLIDFYLTCPWPGNIRQLKAQLMRKKVLSRGRRLVLDESDHELLLEKTSENEQKEILTLEKMKTKYCFETYLKLGKNLAQTAKILSISHNTLKAYLEKREEGLRDNKVIHVNFQDLSFNS